jgi:hypothetical protein
MESEPNIKVKKSFENNYSSDEINELTEPASNYEPENLSEGIGTYKKVGKVKTIVGDHEEVTEEDRKIIFEIVRMAKRRRKSREF